MTYTQETERYDHKLNSDCDDHDTIDIITSRIGGLEHELAKLAGLLNDTRTQTAIGEFLSGLDDLVSDYLSPEIERLADSIGGAIDTTVGPSDIRPMNDEVIYALCLRRRRDELLKTRSGQAPILAVCNDAPTQLTADLAAIERELRRVEVG
jgi:hypothetical protein